MNPKISQIKSATFGRHAGRLTHFGYDVIPITRPTDPIPDAGKRPAMPNGWQNGCPVGQWDQYRDCGLGILTERTPAIDIDVLDEGLADKIQAVLRPRVS
jgi:hypothetical protein